MSDEVKPALSENEWQQQGFDASYWGADNEIRATERALTVRADVDWESGEARAEVHFLDEARHKLAALALHGQPFGFAREDVYDLVTAANDARQVATRGGPDAALHRALAARLEGLAGRLVALLPPPEGTDG